MKVTDLEWQTETLASPDATNAQLEGDDVSSADTVNTPTRIGNKTQIFRKVRIISGTADAVDLAGRASEAARQKLLAGKEAMRDLEKRAIGNYASNSQSGSTPRRMGGLLSYLTSNVSRGSGGTSGGFSSGDTTAAGNGTQRTFTEDQLKTVMASAFNNGAHPSQVYMSAADKQVFSTFAGIADIRADAVKGKTTIYGAADFYQSDFGLLAAIPHPYGLTRDAVFVDPEMAALATLRPWNTTSLAKSGDADKFMLIGEHTLEVRNEAAHGVVSDLN